MGELIASVGEYRFVQFQWAGVAVVWWIESKCDRVGVLRGCVEGVAEVHKECVAAPPEPILDKRV